MSATSLLARIGLRSGTLGLITSLAYAAPQSEGYVAQDSHTYAGRTGWFHPTATSMGFVADATEVLRLTKPVVSVLNGAQFQAQSGTQTAPGVAFEGFAGTGMYNATNDLSFATAGVRRFLTNVSGVISDVPFQAPAGVVTDPTYTFVGDTNTGLFSTGSDSVSVGTNGTERTRWYADGGVRIGTTFSGSPGVGALSVQNGIITSTISMSGTVDAPNQLLQVTPQYVGGASAAEVNGIFANPSVQSLTGNKTGTVGLSCIRTEIDTNSALTSAVTVTGMAGWYEKSNLGFALGGGGALAITNYYGGYVANMPALAAGVTIINQYGLYLEAPTRGGTINASLRALGLIWFDAAEDHAITQVSGNTNLDATHFTVLVDASGGPVTISLPDSTATNAINGRVYNVKKIDSSANAVTVQRTGASDQIDGATTNTMTVQYQSRTYQCRTASAAANRWSVI